MSTTYCKGHDWGDNASYDLENLFKPHDEYDIGNNVCNNIESGFGRVSTLGNNDPTTLEYDKCYICFPQFQPHDEYDIDNRVCSNIESEFGSVPILRNNDHITLENDQSYEIFDKSGLGEVMTLFDYNSTILEDCQLCMHLDHEEKILYDS